MNGINIKDFENKTEDLESLLKFDNEALNKFENECASKVQDLYKDFLLARYGFIPDIDKLLDFYKANKITVTNIGDINVRRFIVREKGHKVFVLKMWDEHNNETNLFDFCILVEERVMKRKKK